MGSRLSVFLTPQQDKTLFNLRTADAATEVIRLSAHGWYVEKIAAHFNWTAQTVREVLHKWQKLGMKGLWSKPGRGRKPKWTEVDMMFLEECLEKEPRTYKARSTSPKIRTRTSGLI